MRNWYVIAAFEGTKTTYKVKASSKQEAITKGMEKAKAKNPDLHFESCVLISN
jgi:hypothetical protein